MKDEGAPIRARDRGAGPRQRPRKKGKGLGILLSLFVLAPAAVYGWYAFQSAEHQAEIRAKIPPGWEDRATKAGICLAALFVLAKIVLPVLHGAAGGLRRQLAWLRTRPTILRVLLFPYELVVWLLYTIARVGFAADAVLIIAACLLTLVLVVRILKPEFLQSWMEIVHLH